MKEIKIAVLSNVNLDLLKPYLEEEFSKIECKASVYLSGFNQYRQDILNHDSPYYKFSPQFTILFLDPEVLYENLLSRLIELSKEDYVKYSDGCLDELINLVETANTKLKGHYFLVNNLPSFLRTMLMGLDTNSEMAFNEVLKQYNTELASRLKNNPQAVIVNYEGLLLRYGSERIYDQRLWYLGRMRFGREGLEHLSRLYVSYLKSIMGFIKKCLVLDLDNTLWGGIIGEDGKESLLLGEEGIALAYKDFQREILNLYKKGILLAVCSKNNHHDAMDVIKTHPHMVLKENHFADIKINWNPKFENLKSISEDLNIGLDSFVFIDDDPRERSQVRQYCKEVTVPEFPEDISQLRNFLLDIEESFFNKLTLTHEDREKSKQYHAQIKRDTLKKQSRSLEEFYVFLKMVATIKRAEPFSIPRISQLTQKTNQFNLTTVRYTVADIEHMANDNNFMAWSLSLSDVYGDNGIVGVIIVKQKSPKEAEIDTFLLSCRVIGKTVEDLFLGYVVDAIKEKGIKRIYARYIPTEKNILVKDLYDKFGFERIDEKSSGEKIYSLSLEKNNVLTPKWFVIND